ncbi:MAG: radical SAM protein [Peptococcaceae bacterium]|jgi:putative pyruvate formate lyase activating enzyme|nr:radical SAM protein [Peptococcaceae bacterium]
MIVQQNQKENLYQTLTCCQLCPRHCKVNRLQGARGYCGAPGEIIACRAALHFWEEPCLSGTRGSGTVFFAYCPLQCVYCQNYLISQGRTPTESNQRPISPERLVEVFFSLADQGAHNINLVTPTHFVPLLIPALEQAKKQNLSIPIVYNTSSYECLETLNMLDGLIDIYLPDLKYYHSKWADLLSHAPDYFPTACTAIDEMVRQVDTPLFDADGILQKGVIIRHLTLPSLLSDSKRVLEEIVRRWYPKVWVSIMRQYTPLPIIDHPRYSFLQEKITDEHYDALVDYAVDLGIEQGFVQEGEAAAESFIPLFDGTGIHK